jgi:hypothetical protein
MKQHLNLAVAAVLRLRCASLRMTGKWASAYDCYCAERSSKARYRSVPCCDSTSMACMVAGAVCMRRGQERWRLIEPARVERHDERRVSRVGYEPGDDPAIVGEERGASFRRKGVDARMGAVKERPSLRWSWQTPSGGTTSVAPGLAPRLV